MNHVTPNLWTTSISYGYLMLNGKEIQFIKVLIIGLHVIMLWSLFSNEVIPKFRLKKNKSVPYTSLCMRESYGTLCSLTGFFLSR
jgi:hypothetical protein